MSASCFSMSPSYEYSGLNSFRIDWLDLLAVQGTLKSLLQHHSLNTISPYEYSGLISFRIDWFDLLAVQGTLKSLLQHHSLKASILWLSAFFTVQISHPHMTTGKTIALTIWIFVHSDVSAFFFFFFWKQVPFFIPHILYTQPEKGNSYSIIIFLVVVQWCKQHL